MTGTQKLILIVLAVVGLLFLIVGFTLMHYIGGFMHTVEEEARKEEEAAAEPRKEPPDPGKDATV